MQHDSHTSPRGAREVRQRVKRTDFGEEMMTSTSSFCGVCVNLKLKTSEHRWIYESYISERSLIIHKTLKLQENIQETVK